MPSNQLTNEVKAIGDSGFFDTDYYLTAYPDVKDSGMDPILHYVAHGSKEQRNPSPFFDTAFYLAMNPDVAKAGINPLFHYLQYGIGEGRQPAKEGSLAPLVSVIIPVYEGEHLLQTALDSIVAQTFKNLEVILVNDGSKDESQKALQQYTKKYKNFHGIWQENQGILRAIETGYNHASGKYLFIMDQDDALVPEALTKLVAKAELEGADLVTYNFIQFEGGKETYQKYNVGHCALWTKLILKRTFDKINIREIPSLNLLADWVPTHLLYFWSEKIVHLDEYLYHYYIHDKNNSSIMKQWVFDDMKTAWLYLYPKLNSLGASSAQMSEIARWKREIVIWARERSYKNSLVTQQIIDFFSQDNPQ